MVDSVLEPIEPKKAGFDEDKGANIKSRGSVIFVHGLGGHHYTTWGGNKKGKGKNFWPLWLAEEFPDLRFYTWGYEAAPSHLTGDSLDLHDLGEEGLQLLKSNSQLEDGPIAFICHSLGGLVVKQALRLANERRKNDRLLASIVDRVTQVVFIATPHSGSAVPVLMRKWRTIFRPTVIMRDLAASSQSTIYLGNWYIDFCDPRQRNIEHLVFREKKRTFRRIIVDEASSNPGVIDAIRVPVLQNHIKIAKPKSKTSAVYRDTSGLLKKLPTRPWATDLPKSLRDSPKKVAFITPGTEVQPFYTAAREFVQVSAGACRDFDLHVIPQTPLHSFDTNQLWVLVNKFFSQSRDVDGVIFSPDNPQHFVDLLKGNADRREPLPVVLFDVSFDLVELEKMEPDSIPYSVGGDEWEGGKIAGKIAVEHCRRVGLSAPPQVHVLIGAETAWERGRVDGFVTEIKEVFPEVKPMLSHPLLYSRLDATTYCGNLFTSASRESCDLDIIFACNDAMAFGAKSAVLEARSRGVKFKNNLGIVGYDGVSEMRYRLHDREEFLIGTVNVHVEKQAEMCIQFIKNQILVKYGRDALPLHPGGGIRLVCNNRVALITPTAEYARRL